MCASSNSNDKNTLRGDVKVGLNEETCHVLGYLWVEMSVLSKLNFQFNSISIRIIEDYFFYLTK